MNDFQFSPADTLSLTTFCLFSLFMFLICLRALRKAQSRIWMLGFLVLVLLFSLLPASGMIKSYFIPLGPILLVTMVVLGTLFAFSESGGRLVSATSLTVLIGFQSFRLPLELILHRWAEMQTVPSTMTWTGSNWDIITGIVSLASIPIVEKSRKLAWVVQMIGVILLLNVFRVVIMSSPLPFSWAMENPLQLLMYFPYALIVPLFVLPALAGHLLTFRKLHLN